MKPVLLARKAAIAGTTTHSEGANNLRCLQASIGRGILLLQFRSSTVCKNWRLHHVLMQSVRLYRSESDKFVHRALRASSHTWVAEVCHWIASATALQ